jgi:hypothetical protein
LVLEDGAIDKLNKGLRHAEGEGPQPRAKATDKNKSLHSVDAMDKHTQLFAYIFVFEYTS